MNSRNLQTDKHEHECQESLQQLQTVVHSLITLTRQLLARVSEVDIDVINNTLVERRQLLSVAQTLRDKFVYWKHEQRVSDLLKQSMMPLVIELCSADEQLMLAVQQRKHDVVEQLARLHRVHNLERYVR
jgi:hypothetical protein